ncbi:MAG: beta-ketoacyl-[acyl-carrier-protein] synthase family protein [Verrucomicrobiales bacterium]|nr:beta-ketoacyl-[acyl-carrier-protein] synthase family protein [Verrucomicrobiales bacterium]
MLFPGPNESEPRRVVVTGAGILTGLGHGWAINAARLRAGDSAVRPVTLFDVSAQRAKRAAEVDLPAELPPSRLSPKRQQRLDRGTRLLMAAGHEALRQTGWRGEAPVATVLGTTCGGMVLGEEYLTQALRAPGHWRGQATRTLYYQAQRQGVDFGDAAGIEGSVTVLSNACASGANAIGQAFELVRHGRAERALAGGYDALCQLVFSGFDSLQALSTTTCRPFDAARDGLALGEGAGLLALESEDSARRRGATILGEIAGYGATTDIHHLTQPHPEGAAALAAMRKACAQARVTPEQVGYVNAHGTGTPHNDSSEARALVDFAGNAADRLQVSSTKGGLGHLLGAAGAVEAVVCLMVLTGQWLPPQLQLAQPDPLCRFRLIREPTDAAVDVALSNSFGFGGANATLVLRRWA